MRNEVREVLSDLKNLQRITWWLSLEEKTKVVACPWEFNNWGTPCEKGFISCSALFPAIQGKRHNAVENRCPCNVYYNGSKYVKEKIRKWLREYENNRNSP